MCISLIRLVGRIAIGCVNSISIQESVLNLKVAIKTGYCKNALSSEILNNGTLTMSAHDT